jgi:hypothetical protein
MPENKAVIATAMFMRFVAPKSAAMVGAMLRVI